MMSNLSVRRREEEGRRREVGSFVRSLRADEIKRDDLAIHASSDDDDASDALSSGTVSVFWSNTDRQFSVFLQDILIKVHIAGSNKIEYPAEAAKFTGPTCKLPLVD